MAVNEIQKRHDLLRKKYLPPCKLSIKSQVKAVVLKVLKAFIKVTNKVIPEKKKYVNTEAQSRKETSLTLKEESSNDYIGDITSATSFLQKRYYHLN